MTPEMLIVFLSWAAYLSGYPNLTPEEPPELRFESHAFFVENVCGGKECKVVGWYDDQDIVYIDKRYEKVDSGFVTSLVVHEFTHFLQHKSGNFNESCKDKIRREREAYYIQNLYRIEAQTTVGMIPARFMTCDDSG